MMPLVFVVDGFPERRHAIRSALERAGHPVEIFATTHALEATEEAIPEVMVIASVLPDGDGVQFCRRIREVPALSRTCLILLSDSNAVVKELLAESGANTVVSAPIIPEEVVAAVEASLLQGPWIGEYRDKDDGDIVINSAAMRIAVRGKEISTTTLEFRLIDYMARHQGKVFTRDALLDAVWGDLQFVTPRSVDACIRRVRRKIEPHASSPTYLKSVRGIGYKLEAKPFWESDTGLCNCPTCSATRVRMRPGVRGETFSTSDRWSNSRAQSPLS